MKAKSKYTLKNIFTEYDDVITTTDLRKMLNISKRQAHKLLKEKKILSVMSGPVFYIPKRSVISFLNKMEEENSISKILEEEEEDEM
ncbi:MAG: helix-turn-helix domain-containing protein [Clostridia bacterium]|nr:helix-turn-helix domain-containing protein [Clostridia bacterium]